MSFLLGGEYESSSSSSGESDDEAQQPDMKEQQEVEKDEDVNTASSVLPSADDALSSVTSGSASFRAPGTKSKHVPTFDRLKKDQAEEKEKNAPRQTASDGENLQKQDPESKTKAAGGSTTTKREAAFADERTGKRQNLAKDRVKSQRVKGQSGIGSDFRSWKSEKEMVLRQQFD